MAYIVRLPGLGMQTDRATLVAWHADPGDRVEEGEVVAEIETEKATAEIEARESGVLRRVYVEAGEEARPNDPLAIVADPDEDVSELEARVAESGEAEPAAGEAGSTAEEAEPTAGDGAKAEGAGANGPPAKATPRAKRRAEELGVDLAAVEGTGPDGAVTADDVESVASEGGEAADEEGGERIDEEADEGAGEEVRATPRAKRRAEELGVDLAAVEGTGPGGAVTEDDVASAATAGSAGVGDDARDRAARTVREERELSRMRRTIADRLGRSYREAVHVTVEREVDARQLRSAAAAAADALDADVGFVDVLLVALSATLEAHPEFNATFEEGTHRIYEEHNVGVAVDIEGGLVNPVLPDVGSKSLAEIASERRALTERALAGEYTTADLRGGTFSVTNLGHLGVESFDPIIDPPQVAILGVGALVERARPANDGVAFRPRLPLSLSFDHRVVDGADAARFLETLAGHLEDPWPLLPEAVAATRDEGSGGTSGETVPRRSVTARSDDGFAGTVTAGGAEWAFDGRAKEDGDGRDEGSPGGTGARSEATADGTAPTPVTTFLGALSACLSASVGYQADMRDVDLSGVTVEADATPDRGSVESLALSVTLDADGDVDEATLDRIVEMGERSCHVSELLREDLPVDLSWELADG